MAQDTKQSKNQKLTESARADVVRALRKIKNQLEDVGEALKFIDHAVNETQLTSNQDLAHLEEMFDVIRDAAKGIPLKSTQDRAEILLLAQLNNNLPKFSVTDAGTVSSSKRKFWKLKNPELFIKHCQDNEDFEGFTQAVSSDWCNAYYKDNKKLPPGIDFWEKTTLSFTKPRKKPTK